MALDTERGFEIGHIDSISPEQLDPELARKLPLEFLKQQRAIPIRLDHDVIAVALADTLNVEAYDAIANAIGCSCERVTCPADEIEHAIGRCYYLGQETNGHDQEREGDGGPNSIEAIDARVVQTHAEDLLNIAQKAPVVKLVNKILFHAVHSRASDIHVEPYETETRIRYRVDGVLHEVLALPKHQAPSLLSRLKIMANLNIAEKRLPQDGQSRVKIGPDLVDIRVSVIPTSGGERIVLRLLDKGRGELRLEQIGLGRDLLEVFRRLVHRPHGIVLLTGPTGSGKTTTLYAALNELNSQQRNILTVEDPIEYQLRGIGQMQVQPKIGLTFASCLRHILRQDPDVIMIGEIRDRETAQIAIQASLTGHLVLSTLHTNDSASAVNRLMDMGIEPYLISSSVAAVMAQRLLRVICPHCKEPMHERSGDAQEDGLYRGAGCDECLETGYLGRTGIFELLVVDDALKELIVQRATTHQVKKQAVNKGMTTLRADGMRKAHEGWTTLEEVYRVTQDSPESDAEEWTHVGG